MKKALYRLIAVCVAVCAHVVSHAQIPTVVNDPVNTAQSIYNGAQATTDAFSNLTALLQTLDVAEEHMAKFELFKQKMEDLTENIQKAQKFINDARDFVGLFEQLQAQIKLMEVYAEIIKSSATKDFNEYYLSNLINNTVGMAQNAQMLMATISKIINETGLTKGEKKQLTDELYDKVQTQINESNEKIMSDLIFMQDVSELVAFLNLFLGREPGSGLNCIGSNTSVSKTESPAPAPASEAEVKAGGKAMSNVIFDIIFIIIGISCLGSLMYAFGKYIVGAYESENIFLRIFGVVVIVIIVFTIIRHMVFGA